MRPQVKLFAEAMERELKANDHKGGWLECSGDFLRAKLKEELSEFSTALDNNSNRILSEGADVGNIIMMLIDIYGGWRKQDCCKCEGEQPGSPDGICQNCKKVIKQH